MDPSGQAAAQAAAGLTALWDLLNDLRIVSYFEVLSVAVFVYDYIITIGMEIEYIWPARWNILKILYLFQRYLPFVDTGYLALYRQFARAPSTDYCSVNTLISGWLLTASITVSEVILSYRVLVVWERNTTMTIILPIFFLMCWGPTLWVTTVFFSSVVYSPPPIPMAGCFVSEAKLVSYIDWLILLGYETVLMILLLAAAARKSHPRGHPLTTMIYRDGIVYYIYLFVLSIGNVIALLMLPRALGQMLSSLERVMYSILTSRVVLHIREYASKLQPSYHPDSHTGETIHFRVERSLQVQVDPYPSPSITGTRQPMQSSEYLFGNEEIITETERRAHSVLTGSDVGIVLVNFAQAI